MLPATKRASDHVEAFLSPVVHVSGVLTGDAVQQRAIVAANVMGFIYCKAARGHVAVTVVDRALVEFAAVVLRPVVGVLGLGDPHSWIALGHAAGILQLVPGVIAGVVVEAREMRAIEDVDKLPMAGAAVEANPNDDQLESPRCCPAPQSR